MLSKQHLNVFLLVVDIVLISTPTMVPIVLVQTVNKNSCTFWCLKVYLMSDISMHKSEYLNTSIQVYKYMINQAGVPSWKWPTGRISKLFPGDNNRFREVILILKQENTRQVCTRYVNFQLNSAAIRKNPLIMIKYKKSVKKMGICNDWIVI